MKQEIYYEMADGHICLCHGEQLPEISPEREGKEVAL